MHRVSLILIELYKLYEYDKAKSYDRFMAHHSGENSVVRGIENGRPKSCSGFWVHILSINTMTTYYVIVRTGRFLLSR